MKILIIGGRRFLGRHLVETALSMGHEITLFNRGQTNPHLFPDVETITGDRDGGLEKLKNRSWDAIIDTCGDMSRIVKASAESLADAVDRYVFISSIQVYADLSAAGNNETSPTAKLEDGAAEEATEETFGARKALCEKAVEETFPNRALVVRPGLLVGPYDTSDRFTYWPHRARRGGRFIAPQPKDKRIQIIDTRDLSAWLFRKIEDGTTGIFNACGPEYPLTMKAFLEKCITATGSDAEIVWVDKDFLLEQKVKSWTEIPLWLPKKEYAGMLDANNRKTITSGLTFRDLAETIRDTLSWADSRPSDYKFKSGLDPEREKEILKAWYDAGN
jgi:2'-hydroxyisoflavone reductase